MFRSIRFKSETRDGLGSYETEDKDPCAPRTSSCDVSLESSVDQSHLREKPALQHASTSRTSYSTFGHRPRESSTSSSTDPLGLQVIHDPEDAVGDLVFVHGLGGSAWKTWSWNRDTSLFWPHWLPDEDELLSKFRMVTFGYNARFQGSAKNLDIIDFSKDLLFQLGTTLEPVSDQSSPRPIIFVAHSLGGLVVKKAFILGRHDDQYSDMMARVQGIVFLATPHRGSQYAKILNNVLAAAPLGLSSKAYVSGLDAQSATIQDINESFKQACGQITLCSFYETVETKAGGIAKVMIVDKDSAVLGYPNEVSAAMDADHHTICKFSHSSDPNFIKLRGILRSWASKMVVNKLQGNTAENELVVAIPDTMSMRSEFESESDHRARIMNILDIDLLAVRANDTDLSPTGSYHHLPGNWLFEHENFCKWRIGTTEERDEASIRHFGLIGLPGAGKTTLSRSTIRHLKLKGHRVFSYFFEGLHQLKKTGAFCLRSLIAQIAMDDVTFRQALFQHQDREGQFFQPRGTCVQSMWALLIEGLLFPYLRRASSPSMTWVLDAIDESVSASELFAKITKVPEDVPLKIFFSSRPMKGLPTPDSHRTTLHFLDSNDTASDMVEYVSQVLSIHLPGDAAIQESVKTQILDRSRGSFLWTRLVLESIQDGHTVESIQAALDQVPAGMNAMYEQMLSNMDNQQPQSRSLARRILFYVGCSWRPLRMDELADALKQDFGTFTNLTRTIEQVCGHFVTLEQKGLSTQPTATLIHATAKEFLFQKHNDGNPAFATSGEAHRVMAMTCLNYLCWDKWRAYFSEVALVGNVGASCDLLQACSTEYPFLDYAVEHWAYHLSKSTVNDEDLLQSLETFLTEYSLTWTEAVALSGSMTNMIRSSRHLKTFIKRTRLSHRRAMVAYTLPRGHAIDPPVPDLAEWIQPWATDFVKIACKFSENLLEKPSSVHQNIPPLCPSGSVVARTFAPWRCSRPGQFMVSGLASQGWDDCLASVTMGNGQHISQVLASYHHFFTLSSFTGKISVWNTQTCDLMHTIKSEECLPLMTLNASGSLLAAAGFQFLYVWETSSGRLRWQTPKALDAMVKDIGFKDDDHLVVAYNGYIIHTVFLGAGEATQPVELDRASQLSAYQGCPRRAVFSPDQTKLAMAWRGHPPVIWSLNAGSNTLSHRQRIIKCKTRSSTEALLYAEKLAWNPATGDLFILCQGSSLFRWRLVEDDISEFSQIRGLDMAISPDGNFLMTTDQAGTSIWAFPGLHLIYRLSNTRRPSTSMVFGPDGQRFYSIRNSICNVLEPDVLVRPDDQDIEDTSSATGSNAVTEPAMATQDEGQASVSFLAKGPDNGCFVCGREDGTVIIHSTIDGSRQRKVFTHAASRRVTRLSWSITGKYMASCDSAGFIIIKRLKLKEPGSWAVFPVLERRMDKPVQQLVFASDERFLLITTTDGHHTIDLKEKKEICGPAHSSACHLGGSAGFWTSHPQDSEYALCHTEVGTNVAFWDQKQETPAIACSHEDDIGKVSDMLVTSFLRPALHTATVDEPNDTASSALHCNTRRDAMDRKVFWASDLSEGRQHLVALSDSSEQQRMATRNHINTMLELRSTPVKAESRKDGSAGSAPSPRRLPQIVSEKCKLLLAIIQDELIFLGVDGWIYSFDLFPYTQGRSTAKHLASVPESGLKEHFYLPKDWLNTPQTQMTIVNDEGTLLVPRQGEVAIVRNGIIL